MSINIYNEDCRVTLDSMQPNMVDVILTSPFYNTNEKAGRSRTLNNTAVKNGQYNYVRYDVHCDNMTDDEYIEFSVNLFKQFDKVLKPNGVVLYNISYGSKGCDNLIDVMYSITHDTPFSVADTIIWKKPTALPNSCSPNKLTRICEYVFVLCRKTEFMTFHTNKQVTSLRKTGQKAYRNICNFIEAKNNDGSCPYNKATFSSELVEKLLQIYATRSADTVVYDPFMGSGTTAIGCQNYGVTCIGSEISQNQVAYANNRLNENKMPNQINLFDEENNMENEI